MTETLHGSDSAGDMDFLDEEMSGPLSGEGKTCRFTVTGIAGKTRLDAFLCSVTDFSRSRIKKLVEQGACLVDGMPCADADFRVCSGQVVDFRMPEASDALVPEDGPVDVLYSDEDIAVINKPAGLTMHPCPSCPSGTLVQRLVARFPALALQEGQRPGIVHRLDKDTSGLVIVALSERARLRLVEDFAASRVHKTYLAVTRGGRRQRSAGGAASDDQDAHGRGAGSEGGAQRAYQVEYALCLTVGTFCPSCRTSVHRADPSDTRASCPCRISSVG